MRAQSTENSNPTASSLASAGAGAAWPLAQFSRGGIVTDLAARLSAAFADNRPARHDAAARGAPARAAARLDAGGLLVSVLWGRIKALFATLFGRS